MYLLCCAPRHNSYTAPPSTMTLLPGSHRHSQFSAGARMEDNTYSTLFYIMLVIGIIGVIGFLFVAIGGSQGGF
jgi:hypothetical protein